MYPPIDLEQTGIKLKSIIKAVGYDVKYIQQYLHLSCPQSIYRWLKGKILPSVEHLSVLSILLGVHMEELLVLKKQPAVYDIQKETNNHAMARLLCYRKYIINAA